MKYVISYYIHKFFILFFQKYKLIFEKLNKKFFILMYILKKSIY